MRCNARQIRRTDRNGMVAVQVVVSITALVGVAAIVLDGGLLLTERRHAQAAADAAALAGATELFKNFKTNGGADPSGTAAAAARDYVTQNYATAFQSNIHTPITVNIPPSSAQSLPAHRKAGYVEVIVQYNHPRLFSSIFGGSSIPISARAVAQGTFLPPAPAVLALDLTASPGLKVTGGGLLNIQGSGTVVVDSNAGSALANNGGGTISDTEGAINVTGGVSGGGTYTPAPTTGTAPIPDPYAYLPTPGVPAYNGSIAQRGNTGIWDIWPGKFASDPFSGGGAPKNNDIVYFHDHPVSGSGSAIYYMQSSITTSNIDLRMARYDTATPNPYSGETGGMMLYMASGSLSITGNPGGSTRLDGLASGTYQGILIFQARSDTQKMKIAGNGNLFSLAGEIYAPTAEIDLTGNGALSTIGTGVIGDTVVIAGNGTINVAYNASSNTSTRVLTLVE